MIMMKNILKFNSDDNVSLKITVEIYNIAIIVRCVFYEEKNTIHKDF